MTCADRGAAMSTLATTFRPAHPPGPALPPRHTPPSPQEQYHNRDRPITSTTEELPITVAAFAVTGNHDCVSTSRGERRIAAASDHKE